MLFTDLFTDFLHLSFPDHSILRFDLLLGLLDLLRLGLRELLQFQPGFFLFFDQFVAVPLYDSLHLDCRLLLQGV